MTVSRKRDVSQALSAPQGFLYGEALRGAEGPDDDPVVPVHPRVKVLRISTASLEAGHKTGHCGEKEKGCIAATP